MTSRDLVPTSTGTESRSPHASQALHARPDNSGRIIAFIGPSVRRSELDEHFSDVMALPPVRQGDAISTWAKYRPDVIVVIDGEFGQSLSVWHKELLAIMDGGCQVIGAASMGALRAAELERFGMIGVGEVFRHYSGGFLTDDADVALLHTDADDEWRPLTWPMVNCRATLRALMASGQIDDTLAAACSESLERLHFSRRVRPELERSLREQGVVEAAELSRRFEDSYVDQKRLDAIAALEYARELRGVPRGQSERPLHVATRLTDAMRDSDTLVASAAVPLRRYQLVNDIALHERDFEAISQRAVDRLLVLEFAAEIGLQPTEAECRSERERFLASRQLTEDSVGQWLIDNDLDADELRQLVMEEATRRRMQRWALDARHFGRNRRAVLDQLRLEGRYREMVQRASQRRRAADSQPTLSWPQSDAEVHELIRRHRDATGWEAQTSLGTTAEDHGFENVAGLILALLDAEASRRGLQP